MWTPSLSWGVPIGHISTPTSDAAHSTAVSTASTSTGPSAPRRGSNRVTRDGLVISHQTTTYPGHRSPITRYRKVPSAKHYTNPGTDTSHQNTTLDQGYHPKKTISPQQNALPPCCVKRNTNRNLQQPDEHTTASLTARHLDRKNHYDGK